MKVQYFVRKNKSKLTINFEFRNGSVRYRASTPYSLNAIKEWDEKKERIKIPSTRINANIDNANLNLISTKFVEGIAKFKINEITIEDVRKIYLEVIDDICGKKITSNNDDTQDKNKELNEVLKYYDYYTTKYQTHPTPSTKKVLKKTSIGAYNSSKKQLKAYLDNMKISRFTFDQINEEFYENYLDFLFQKDYTSNYIGTLIDRLKTIMKSAFEKGVSKNTEYLKPYFISPSEDVNLPYLNLDEIESIAKLNLTDSNDRNIRDIFLIQCHTGFRIEDLLAHLKKPNIIEQEGIKFLYTIQGKTGGEIYVPMNTKVKQIIANNNGNLPKYVHQNQINERIKIICEKAKITENYTVTRTHGNTTRHFTEPKFKFISTHTARRSFCTNAYMSKVPVHHIMAISGHKTEKIFLNYLKMENKLEALMIGKTPYFL
ncbi:MAG: hypothetical protein RLY43_766 [Bacteroidota bacterium]|jgi:integrase